MSVLRTIKRIDPFVSVIAGLIAITGALYGLNVWWQNRCNSCNLNGQWKFTSYTESSSFKPAIGKSAEFQIYLQHQGNTVKGDGEKTKVDGVYLPIPQHDRLSCTGSVNERIFNVTYQLSGKAARTTDGYFKMKIKNDKEMEGTFAGNAANTKGRVVAIKVSD